MAFHIRNNFQYGIIIKTNNTMKKLNYLMTAIFAVLSLCLTACSSDDDEVGGSSKIVGTWKSTSTDEYGDSYSWTFTFGNDGNFSEIWKDEDGYTEKSSGTYVFDDNKNLNLHYSNGYDVEDGDGNVVYKVTELTSKKMVIDVEYYDAGPGIEIETFYKQ